MKRIAIISISLLIGAVLSAQQKGDTGIQLITEYPTVQDAVSGIMSVLAQSGIAPEKADKDLGMVNTTALSTKTSATLQAYFYAYAQSDTVYVNVTGQGYSGVHISHLADNPIQVTRKGQKGSILLSQWETLEALALKIPHTDVKYINPNPPEKRRK